METGAANLAPLSIRIAKRDEHFRKVRDAEGGASGMGRFFLELQVTALTETVYIPSPSHQERSQPDSSIR
jgi:hypothetical protein